MPELPEVEVVRIGLAEHILNRTITAVEVLHPRAVRRHHAGGGDFSAQLLGTTLADARRRGKYLWLPIADSDGGPPMVSLLAHLGMSGQLLVGTSRVVDQVHLRVRLRFADDTDLRFVDQRTFGGLSVERLAPDSTSPHLSEAVPEPIAHIARDPLDPSFDVDEFATRLRRRRTGIKRALLDQSLISGIGNIYADEALWRARLHYARPSETLNRPTIARVLDAVAAVMREALAQGGTSFDRLYVNVTGQNGYFDRSLDVYGREDRPCHRCGAPIVRQPFMNRSSYFCPRCQPRPRRARY